MTYMLVWFWMIVGQFVCVLIGVSDIETAVTASYWCGMGIFACWLRHRPARSAPGATDAT